MEERESLGFRVYGGGRKVKTVSFYSFSSIFAAQRVARVGLV